MLLQTLLADDHTTIMLEWAITAKVVGVWLCIALIVWTISR